MSNTMTVHALIRTLKSEIVTGNLSVETKMPVAEKVKKHCGCCRKKLALSDFNCAKCSVRYCGDHRLPETHACQHDFRKEGQQLLTKLNPRVVTDKVENRI